MCGRENNQPLIMRTKADVDMEIIKKPIPGTSEMTYKVHLAPKEPKQKCRICGTYYDYKPPGCYVENYFVQEGDTDLIVYRKHKEHRKQLEMEEKLARGEDVDEDEEDEDETDPSKRKKKERVVVLGDKPPLTQYLASKDEIFAEIEAAREPGYKGYTVKKSRPPRLASDHEFKDNDMDEDELAMLESQEAKDAESEAHKAALARAREGEKPKRQGIWIIFDLMNYDDWAIHAKIAELKEKRDAYKVRFQEKVVDAKVKRDELKTKFMESKPTQLTIKTYRTMKAVYKVAEDAAYASRRRAELETDMVFNDYRFKRRELEFRPPFPRHRSPNPEENEFFPLHANIESIAHNPNWFPGVITRVHMNNTYDIRFDNGEDVQCVEARLIRFRLRTKVSVLMQWYAITFIFFVAVMPLELGIFYASDYKYKVRGRNRWCNSNLYDDSLYDDYKKFEGEPRSARFHHDDDRSGRMCMGDARIGLLVTPVFIVSFVMTFAHGLQLFNSYIMRTHAAGCLIHLKFWIVFAWPGIFLSLLCYMAWGKLSDGGDGGGSPWVITLAPILPFTMSLAGQAYFMQPLYAKFLVVAGGLFSIFVIFIGMDFDFPLLWPSIYPDVPLFVVFMPGYLLWGVLWRYLPYIDYIWDAAIGPSIDVEPDLAGEKATSRRLGTH